MDSKPALDHLDPGLQASRNLGLILGQRADSGELAIVFVDSAGRSKHYSFRSIDKGCRAVAGDLQSRGLRPGSRVGILGINSVEYLCAYLGIMRAGLVAVPVNQKQPEETIAFICEDASLQLLYADEASRTRVENRVLTLSLEALPQRETGFIDGYTDPDSTALILYTSGSTGRPKGVVLSHASQLAMVDHVHTDESTLFSGQMGIVVAPMFHMNALVFLESYLAGGGSLVLMSKFNAEIFAQAIEEFQVNMITGVPTMIALLYSAWAKLDKTDLSSVHTVYIGSAPVTQAIVEQAKAMAPDAIVLNSYGTTETGGGLFGAHPQGVNRPSTAVGYPMEGVGIKLIDKQGNEVSDEGVLLVKAQSAMTEYLNLPELTAAKIRDGWINTGDIFQRDENGFFYFIGRDDDMFVCSGENIYPGEVERILESHPAVDQASVVPVPDSIRGQMPVAWVVGSESKVSEAQLQEYVRSKAAPYLYPRRVWFLDELPLAGTSKIDRNLLAAKARKNMDNGGKT